ncbi:collagen-binding domain-containing protein, partial [Liquorilactobacillus aquaticus]|uniref:collagen-binding domain-containing protein n=1 Tax=Liquorilactobacillus aquaticus TaxID=392566 RepID=UPI0030843C66
MKKIVKVAFLSIMALLAFGVVLPSRVHADTNGSIFISKAGGTAEEDFPGVEGNPLGIASVFHIFAMQARLSAHTAGNLAVENLDGKVNFGTNISDGKLAKEVSYIQNITSIQNSSFVQSQGSRTNKIILGKNINVAYTDNGNHLAFNDTKMDHVKESEVYQDQGNEKYIDFEKEFEKLNVNSNTLAQTATSYTIKNSDFSDENNRVIDVSKMSPNENNKIIINLSSDILERDRPLIINGLSKEVNAPTVVFNVDGDGSNYNVGSQIKLRYSDGTERHNKETEDFSDAHILWNFENTKNGQVININAAFQGSILAPNAELNANQNVDGNLIAKTININSETHRWDLQNTTVSTSTTTTGTTEEPSTSSTTTTGTTEEPSTSNTTMTGTTEESSTSSTTMTGTTEEPSTSSTTTTDTTEEPSTSSTATTGTTEEPSTSSTTTTGTTEEPSTSNTT